MGDRKGRPYAGLGILVGLRRSLAGLLEVLAALDGWPGFAEEAGLDESGSTRIAHRFNP